MLVAAPVLEGIAQDQQAGTKGDVDCGACGKQLRFRQDVTCDTCVRFATQRFYAQDMDSDGVNVWKHDKLKNWERDRAKVS